MNLQSALSILGQQGQEPIVGVFANAPSVCRLARRIVKDPEQHGRVGRIGAFEIVAIQPKAEGNALHQGRSGPGRAGHIALHRRPQLRHLSRPQIDPMQGHSRPHPWVVRPKFGAKIKALFQIRLAGGQFAADRKESAPGAAAPGHGNL